jgi:hypothetical protein
MSNFQVVAALVIIALSLNSWCVNAFKCQLTYKNDL